MKGRRIVHRKDYENAERKKVWGKYGRTLTYKEKLEWHERIGKAIDGKPYGKKIDLYEGW